MRRDERQPVSRPARIELGDGKTQACRIANVSRTGALLLVPHSEWLPKTFQLVDAFSGQRHEVRVMWTAPDRAGVRYIASTEPRAQAKRATTFGRRG